MEPRCNILFIFSGQTRRSKGKINYPNLPSAIRPVPHGPGIPVPEAPSNVNWTSDSSSPSHSASPGPSQAEALDFPETTDPVLFTQEELNDLTRDLALSKSSAQILASRLAEKNLLEKDVLFYWYRNREQEFRQYFSQDKDLSLVYCTDIPGLINKLGLPYDSKEWRLFVDSSSNSLKAVLLNIGNKVSIVKLMKPLWF